MRNKTALVFFSLAVICGAALFHTSQKVTDGRSKLETIVARTAKENEALRVLEAEWAYLNQPGKLEKLVKQYLDLVPLKGKQFGKVNELAERAEDAVASSLPEETKEQVTETKQPVAKAEEKPAKPIVKIIPAATPPAVKPAPQPRKPVEARATPPKYPPQPYTPPSTPAPQKREFGDLMKSLGVQ
jgi:hypothetical protein